MLDNELSSNTAKSVRDNLTCIILIRDIIFSNLFIFKMLSIFFITACQICHRHIINR